MALANYWPVTKDPITVQNDDDNDHKIAFFLYFLFLYQYVLTVDNGPKLKASA